MDSSILNVPLDLLKLYKSPETNRYSTFGDFADLLVPADLVAAYRHTRSSAPRRHDRDKSYFVDHSERTNRAEKSNRVEEHLALALWRAARTAAPITLPDGRALEVLDYQMPLKARQKDKGVGKVDLFGLIDDHRVAVECKLTEPEFGTCSRPGLKQGVDQNYDQDFCDGSYTRHWSRKTRCSLSEIGAGSF
jgi:hypothetical protein